MVEKWSPLNDTQADQKLENRSMRCHGECVVIHTHGAHSQSHSHVVQFVVASSSSMWNREKCISMCQLCVTKHKWHRLADKTVGKAVTSHENSLLLRLWNWLWSLTRACDHSGVRGGGARAQPPIIARLCDSCKFPANWVAAKFPISSFTELQLELTLGGQGELTMCCEPCLLFCSSPITSSWWFNETAPLFIIAYVLRFRFRSLLSKRYKEESIPAALCHRGIWKSSTARVPTARVPTPYPCYCKNICTPLVL